jgi:hypothetical protein
MAVDKYNNLSLPSKVWKQFISDSFIAFVPFVRTRKSQLLLSVFSKTTYLPTSILSSLKKSYLFYRRNKRLIFCVLQYLDYRFCTIKSYFFYENKIFTKRLLSIKKKYLSLQPNLEKKPKG